MGMVTPGGTVTCRVSATVVPQQYSCITAVVLLALQHCLGGTILSIGVDPHKDQLARFWKESQLFLLKSNGYIDVKGLQLASCLDPGEKNGSLVPGWDKHY